MSNTSLGKAEKGSKYWIQLIVNTPEMQKQLNRAICGSENLRWISPLAYDEYKEYKLNQPLVIDNMGIIDKAIAKDVFSFWPAQQPQWDGIAISDDNMDYYLVEAKAHISEVRTRMSVVKDNASAMAHENEKLILQSMHEAYENLSDDGDFECWKKKYYQLGNRLTFMYFLNRSAVLEGKRFHIVLLNIVNDTMIPTSDQQWKEHYKTVWKEMLGKARIPDNVHIINWDVR